MLNAAPSPAPTGRDPAPAGPAESKLARWVAVAILALAAAAIAWRFVAQARPAERARLMMADLGAELYDRPLTPAELDAPLEVNPKSPARGAKPTLRELTGQGDVVFVHFWASWCPPCLEELPEIAMLARRLEGTRCSLTAVSYDDDWQAPDSTLERTVGNPAQLAGTWLRDPQGQDGDPSKMLRMFLGTEKLPETWVIVKGRVAARFIAGQKWSQTRMQRVLDMLCPATAEPKT